MKLIQPNDYAIWKKQKICRVVKELLRGPEHFLGPGEPIDVVYGSMIVAGLTEDDKMRICNETSQWVVRDEATGEEFDARGHELLIVNEMQVIAIMARKGEGQ